MHLSEEQYNTITNSQFLLVKAEAMAAIWGELDALTDVYSQVLASYQINLNEANRPAKISKGENYRGLPYLVLDYPAAFDKENILAFRTMFWWGNFFSLTMHLQGIYKEKYLDILLNNIYQIDNTALYICVGDTPWDYHYDKTNYILLSDLSQQEISKLIKEKAFVKLSLQMPLSSYPQLATFMTAGFKCLANLLKY